MLPVLYFSEIPIPMFQTVAALSIFIGSIEAINRARRPINIFKVFLAILFSGIFLILCGKSLYFLSLASIYTCSDITINMIFQGGMVYYGGLLGTLFGFYLFTKITHENFGLLVDYLVPIMCLVHGLGRLGCFLNGCCYGFIFVIGEGSFRFPVQLLECIVELGLFRYLSDTESKFSGSKLLIYLIVYSACRFILEFMRADDYRGVYGLFSLSQYISIVVFVSCLFFYRKRVSRCKN